MRKLVLYSYLKSLIEMDSRVTINPCGEDGWHIFVKGRDMVTELSKICDRSGLHRDDDYWQSIESFIITISRLGMDVTVEKLFDAAASGIWVEP